MIGILGGAFDPVHKGHLTMAVEAYRQAQLSKVLMLPTYRAVASKDLVLSDFDLRVEMLKLAIEGQKGLELCLIERDLPAPSYSIQTLKALHHEQSGPFAWIMGMDQLAQFDRWKDFQQIFELCELLVFKRPGIELSDRIQCQVLKPFKQKIHFLEMPLSDCASSGIRRKLASGEQALECLPKAVQELILREGLYQK